MRKMKNEIIILESVNYGSFLVMKSPQDKASEGFLYYTCSWDESNWTRNIYSGSEFFIIQREGIDIPGIIMHGFIDHEGIFIDQDRPSRGYHGVYIKDYQKIDPDKYRILSVDTLKAAMPEFTWDLATSGRILSGPYVRTLHKIWREYLKMNDLF